MFKNLKAAFGKWKEEAEANEKTKQLQEEWKKKQSEMETERRIQQILAERETATSVESTIDKLLSMDTKERTFPNNVTERMMESRCDKIYDRFDTLSDTKTEASLIKKAATIAGDIRHLEEIDTVGYMDQTTVNDLHDQLKDDFANAMKDLYYDKGYDLGKWIDSQDLPNTTKDLFKKHEQVNKKIADLCAKAKAIQDDYALSETILDPADNINESYDDYFKEAIKNIDPDENDKALIKERIPEFAAYFED